MRRQANGADRIIRLEKRPTPSRFWLYATPVAAVLLTMVAGGLLFAAMGKNPFAVIKTIFWDPVFGEFAFYLRGQLLIKAGPLILIAIGLALGFRAGIWNIGAEGQYIIGAIVGAGVGLAFYPTENRLIFPAMILAGAFGGRSEGKDMADRVDFYFRQRVIVERDLAAPDQTGCPTRPMPPR